MSAVVLIDSSVFIGILRGRRDVGTVLGDWAEGRELATCGMVQVEVLRGIRDTRIRQTMLEFMSVMSFIQSTTKLWMQTAELAWKLDRQGRPIPAADLTIAAAALHAEASLLTYDHHFREIPGLDVIESM